MLSTAPHIANLAQVIQLAVAPVFLLAGVGTTLNALATRVGRIIDRARTMEDRLLHATPGTGGRSSTSCCACCPSAPR